MLPILSCLIFTPLLGAFLILLLPRNRVGLIKAIALISTAIVLGLTVQLLLRFDYSSGQVQFTEQLPWIGHCASVEHPPVGTTASGTPSPFSSAATQGASCPTSKSSPAIPRLCHKSKIFLSSIFGSRPAGLDGLHAGVDSNTLIEPE